jgi:hypothetical protein
MVQSEVVLFNVINVRLGTKLIVTHALFFNNFSDVPAGQTRKPHVAHFPLS